MKPAVIASVAKQSLYNLTDCFVVPPRNDVMEHVIAKSRKGWHEGQVFEAICCQDAGCKITDRLLRHASSQ